MRGWALPVFLLLGLLAAGPGGAQVFDPPPGSLRPKVPMPGPLMEAPPTAQTHIPRYNPDCTWRTQQYYQPSTGWIARRVRVCR